MILAFPISAIQVVFQQVLAHQVPFVIWRATSSLLSHQVVHLRMRTTSRLPQLSFKKRPWTHIINAEKSMASHHWKSTKSCALSLKNGQISWLKKIPLSIGPARSTEKIYTVPGLPILRRNVQVQSQSTAGTLRWQNIHLDPSPQAVLQVILRKWCGKILRSSALPKLSHQNRVKLLLWQITNRLETGLDSTKTMCPHRCKATKIFPFLYVYVHWFFMEKNK